MAVIDRSIGMYISTKILETEVKKVKIESVKNESPITEDITQDVRTCDEFLK